jgi:hypothetical protein
LLYAMRGIIAVTTFFAVPVVLYVRIFSRLAALLLQQPAPPPSTLTILPRTSAPLRRERTARMQLACLARRCVSMPCAWSPFRSPRSSLPRPLPPKPFSPAPPRYCAGHVQPKLRQQFLCRVPVLRGGALACPARGRPFAPRAAACPAPFPLNHSPPHLRAIAQGTYSSAGAGVCCSVGYWSAPGTISCSACLAGTYSSSQGATSSATCLSCAAVR